MAARMEGDPGFRSFAERCEPPEPSAAQGLRQWCAKHGVWYATLECQACVSEAKR